MVERNIELKNLSVHFPVKRGVVKAVENVSYTFKGGEITAVLGESGCGKSVLGQAVLGILPSYVKSSGEILYAGGELLKQIEATPDFYGKCVAVIPQNPSESLNPIRNIRKQFNDILEVGGVKDDDDRLKRQLLESFLLQDIDRVLDAYPFELSGGMQQRVLCAMSVCLDPEWIIADEPTKGLDDKNSSKVYENLQMVKKLKCSSMIIITHDITLARCLSDSIALMYAGQIVENSRKLFSKPLHPYAKAFVAAMPENGFQPCPGKAPEPEDNMEGCHFASRCKYCQKRCLEHMPELYRVDDDTMVRCFLYAEL